MKSNIQAFSIILFAALHTKTVCKVPDMVLTFSKGNEIVAGSTLPNGWSVVRGKGTVYSFLSAAPDVLNATSSCGNTMIGIKTTVSLSDYKFITWKWKAVALPESAMENDKRKNDSACGIYLLFKNGIFPKAIKYVWSSNLPVGSVVQSAYNANVKIIVMESGKEKCNQWVTETSNVKNDIVRCFGEKEKFSRILGFGLLTDADNTRSYAAACYGTIRMTSDTTAMLAEPDDSTVAAQK
jgi:hypothetical protein